ncbi:hypothetical protein H8E77_29205 [bacterium]|nr:hypothetical protein [bacterium]
MKQKLKISILPFSVVSVFIIVIASVNTSRANEFGDPYKITTALFGWDYPATKNWEISLAAIHEYKFGGVWSWHSFGVAPEARFSWLRYIWPKGPNSRLKELLVYPWNLRVTALLAYPWRLKHEEHPEYNDANFELALDICPFSYTQRCLFWNHLDFTISPGFRYSRLLGGVAGKEYDWDKNLIIGVDIKLYK